MTSPARSGGSERFGVILGIQIIDVRLRRADYPTATSQNIFNRMKSEREQEAKIPRDG